MSTADYAGAEWLGNASIHFGGWAAAKRTHIIIHGTGGDPDVNAVARTFEGKAASTHYAVGRDGTVAQYVPEREAAWGNGPITGPAGVGGDGVHHDAWWDTSPSGNPNTVTFSIEHCKSSADNSDAITPAQQAASFALVKHIADRWSIPYHVFTVASEAQLAQGGITGHFSMDPQNRARCPGAYPWAALAHYLGESAGGANMAQIPQGWVDDGTTLTAPGGRVVVQGFREHVIDFPGGWPAELVPVDDAAGLNGDGDTVQNFATRLVWRVAQRAVVTQAGIVVDTEAVARLTAQVTQLQAELAAAGMSGSVEALALVKALRASLGL